MDDEPGEREYGNEMEYEMKGAFLRPRDSNIQQKERLVTTYLFYLLPITNPVHGVFPLVSPKPSFSPHLRVQPFASPLLLGPSPNPTRHALYVRFVPLLSLFCMLDERHVDSWRQGYRGKERNPQKTQRTSAHIKG